MVSLCSVTNCTPRTQWYKTTLYLLPILAILAEFSDNSSSLLHVASAGDDPTELERVLPIWLTQMSQQVGRQTRCARRFHIHSPPLASQQWSDEELGASNARQNSLHQAPKELPDVALVCHRHTVSVVTPAASRTQVGGATSCMPGTRSKRSRCVTSL